MHLVVSVWQFQTLCKASINMIVKANRGYSTGFMVQGAGLRFSLQENDLMAYLHQPLGVVHSVRW